MKPLWLCSMVLAAGCARHIAPVEVQVTAEAAQLARGQYLAESVMACGSCHSRRDWARYAGPPREGTEFAGSGDLARDEGFSEKFSFSARNLTPHPTGLGEWRDGEVARAIVFGQSKDGRGLFPYMPYFEYRDALAEEDLGALVAYLRSLPPVAWTRPGRPRFPMPGFVMNSFPEARELREKAPQPGAADYGRYLTEIGSCRGCHTAADRRGRPIGPEYAGGREFPVPAPGVGIVKSSNLTPDDEAAVGRLTKEAFVLLFRARTLEAARSTPVTAGGANTVMPWWAYARMRDEDLGAIYDYLRTLPASKAPQAGGARAAD